MFNIIKDIKIDCSSKDLIDAYLHIFKLTIHLNEPILILEDDAIIIGTNDEFQEVNKFINNENYSIYSFGSFGLLKPGFKKHKKYIDNLIVGFSQANIWNISSRKYMIENLNLDQMHIDVHLYKQINNKYTYFKPLIVQPFTETENKKRGVIYVIIQF